MVHVKLDGSFLLLDLETFTAKEWAFESHAE